MEGRKLATEFAQLKLPPVAHPTHAHADTDRLFRFRGAAGGSASFSRSSTAGNMEHLVQDFNTALDETAGSNGSNRSTTSKRKAWKRRCKSTSNLVVAGQNLSDDSSSSVDTRGRGTSSLQFSDSDLEMSVPGLSRASAGRSRHNRHDYRGSRLHQTQLGESDSFNENISPFKEFRTSHHSKRRRKMKRMAVDHSPENRKPKLGMSKISRSGSGPSVSVKRKKVRTKSGADVSKSSRLSVTGGGSVSRRSGVLPLGGKRKRSYREKSVESGDMLSSGRSRTASLGDTEPHASLRHETSNSMECDEVCSSSSLSSSEWEDLGSDCSPEADDEQSDWPGPEPNPANQAQGHHLTDEEVDPEISFTKVLAGSRGTQARVIRAGTRKLKNRHRVSAGLTEGSSGVVPGGPGMREALLQFLPDRRTLSLKLACTRSQDRDFLVGLAASYHMSWRLEPGTATLVLSKTCATLSRVEMLGVSLQGAQHTSFAPSPGPAHVQASIPSPVLNLTHPLPPNLLPPGTPAEFAVPGVPAARNSRYGVEQSRLRERKSTDIKRQRRTPPLPPAYMPSQGGPGPRQERQHSGRHKSSKTQTLSGSKSS